MDHLTRSASDLVGLQNADGGWPYVRGGPSWTEATSLALLALQAVGDPDARSAISRAFEWLVNRQRSDGGWAPQSAVPQSTWVTAFAVLAVQSHAKRQALDRAVNWLLTTTGRESSWQERLRAILLGGLNKANPEGWPWYPSAAAWLEPTALTILVLKNLGDLSLRNRAAGRVQIGQSFVLSRQCRDGGWNHGSTQALGYDSDSYPESTGWALLALRGLTGANVSRGLKRAEEHMAQQPLGEGRYLLELGLTAHGRKLPDVFPPPPPSGRCRQLSLWLVAAAAREGRHVL